MTLQQAIDRLTVRHTALLGERDRIAKQADADLAMIGGQIAAVEKALAGLQNSGPTFDAVLTALTDAGLKVVVDDATR